MRPRQKMNKRIVSLKNSNKIVIKIKVGIKKKFRKNRMSMIITIIMKETINKMNKILIKIKK